MTTLVQDLAELLRAAEAALEREDAPAAARAIEAAAAACAAAQATGVRLDREDLARLAEQHAQLEARALQLHRTLASQLEDASRSRRAVDAYGRR